MRRVVVTGMGMVTPLGAGVAHNWARLTSGHSGIRVIDHIDVSDLSCRIAGVVPRGDGTDGTFNPDLFMPPKDQRKTDVFITFAMAAAAEAVSSSGWAPADEEGQLRTGVLIGAGIGGLDTVYETAVVLKEQGPRRVSPFSIPGMLINLASGHVSIRYGFRGPNHSVVTACATGTHAIGDAARMIALDDADVMIAGGAEAAVNRLGLAGFGALRALSTGYNDRPTQASRPFDEGRDGFVMAEGAGIVVLEEYEHARRRGATIHAEIVGYGLSGDANHITAPCADGNGGRRAMEAALRRAGVGSDAVGYINAHGTSTSAGDAAECTAVKTLFGDSISGVSMSSTKSSIGHLLGAAGAVEAIYTIKALETGILPPTLNLETVSESCRGIDLVPKVAKEKRLHYALSNSFGFGGTNASLLLKSFI
ncbi:MAG: beta-ketoacyl-ACP synthase II [Rhodospirillales bacterium]|nr:beta-ketoacyl-ACP synthase II [Rhodospirillales bacterium]